MVQPPGPPRESNASGGFTAEDVNALHDFDDVDVSPMSHHHTLGPGENQAAPGVEVGKLRSEIAIAMPVGTILLGAWSSAPSGFLLANGAAISRTTYAALFSAIGTTYGAGDGSSTFNLPDLRGRVPVGRDAGQTEFDVLGEAGGAKTHTLTVAEMPSHTHTQNPHSHEIDTAGTALKYILRASPGTGNGMGGMASAGAALNATAATATNQNTGGGGAHNNLQPYIVLNYAIKV